MCDYIQIAMYTNYIVFTLDREGKLLDLHPTLFESQMSAQVCDELSLGSDVVEMHSDIAGPSMVVEHYLVPCNHQTSYNTYPYQISAGR